jgi:PAS domain S-box-containing protein
MVPLSEPRLHDVMDPHVLAVPTDCSLQQMVAQLQAQHASHVIVQQAGRPVGMLTERDLVRLLRQPQTPEPCAAQVMSQPIVCVPGTLGFRAAYAQLCLSRLRHLVVVDAAGAVVGIARESDFLGHVGAELYQSVQQLAPLVDWLVPQLAPAVLVTQAIDRMLHERRGCVVVPDGQGGFGLFTEQLAPRALAHGFHGAAITLADVARPCTQVFSHQASVAQVLSQLVADRSGYVLVRRDDTAEVGVIAQSRLLESVRSSIHAEIANRQLVQAQFEQVQVELEQQVGFSRAVLQAMTDGISVCHAVPDFPFVHFTVWNPAMIDLTGYTQDEINQLGWYQSLYPDPKVQARAQVRMERMRRGEDLRHEEWVITRKDAVQRVVDISTSLIQPGDATTVHVMAVMRDVTERKRVEEALAQAKDAAEKASCAKSAFLATMSHEIRTPLNGVLGMAQMLLLPQLQEAQRLEYARTILSSGQTLLTLLNDILDLSKIEAGRFQLELGVVDPASLLSEIHTLFAGAAQAKQLVLTHAWSGPTGQRYITDSTRLRQMLANLVGNAIKFTASGAVAVVGREVAREGSHVELDFAVADTGVGIAPEQLCLLFQPFSQADSSTTRRFGGTGLGLSIVKNLAQVMGGGVGVQSTPGQGSRFWFRVMAQLCASDGNSRRTPRTAGQAGAPPAGARLQGHVLVVEDNSVNAQVIAAMLHALGLGYEWLTDGQQAASAIAQGLRADLILMDLHMPVMDGYTATERIRAWEAQTGAAPRPIVALTADAFEEDRQHCLAVGMDDFLTKPIAMQALHGALERWLPVAS